MGINYLDAKLMWEARLRGASFVNTLTVAHLSLDLHPKELTALRQAYQANTPASTATPLDSYAFGDYADEFIRGFLGAASIAILDYSPYEGATIIHDLNQPIPEQYWGQFDAVIDGGSLEHVFNFPIAMSNLMKMLKMGGHIFIKAPANNLCGHGFYQFSPELMFRVFAKENGFEMRQVLLLETTTPSEITPYRNAYEVVDPKIVGSRVGLTSNRQVLILAAARKIAEVPLFANPPLQSDYVAEWNRGTTHTAGAPGEKAWRLLFAKLPLALQLRLRRYRQLRRNSLSNKRFYRKLHRAR